MNEEMNTNADDQNLDQAAPADDSADTNDMPKADADGEMSEEKKDGADEASDDDSDDEDDSEEEASDEAKSDEAEVA